MEKEIQSLIHSRWPEWEYVKDIGAGAYGSVYQMVRRDLAGEFFSAVKVITIPDDDAETEQLRQEGYTPEQISVYYQKSAEDCTAEIRLLENLRGRSNITAIEDYAIIHPDDQLVWYILIRMELLNRVDYHGMAEKDIICLGIDICTALAECKKMNVFHRDIKPDNILVDETGRYKLGDFGVSRKLERTSMLSLKYTPNYAAPEIAKAEMKHADIAAASRADLYSLGLVMYWISNGCRLPHVPDKQILSLSDRETAYNKRIQGEPFSPPKNVSTELQAIIMKACSYHANERYKDAEEMKTALSHLAGGDHTGTEEGTGTRGGEKKKRYRLAAHGMWGMILVLLLSSLQNKVSEIESVIDPPTPTPFIIVIPTTPIITPTVPPTVPPTDPPKSYVIFPEPQSIRYPDQQGMEIITDDKWTERVAGKANLKALSAHNICKVRPQFYCSTRYRDEGERFGYDLSSLGLDNNFSASSIQKAIDKGTRRYGIYFKFTPSYQDEGFEINRIDFVFTDSQKNIIYSMGFKAQIICKDDYAVAWNFIDLMDMFKEQKEQNGIMKEKYLMEIYFNEEWAGSVSFKVSK